MFENSLISDIPEANTRKLRAELMSFGIQAGVVAAALTVPLLLTRPLPGPVAGPTTPLVVNAYAAPRAAEPAPRQSVTYSRPSLYSTAPILRAPQPVLEPAATAPAGLPGVMLPEAVVTDEGPPALPKVPVVPAPAPAPPPGPMAVGGEVEAARCLYCPAPSYPAMARQVHVQGRVELHAVIAADGAVASVEPVSGNALLTAAALRAVRTWRYQPLLLNQQPTAVDTVITVDFRLPDGPI